MSSSQTDAQLRVLLDAAEQAEARGQAAEANRLLAQARGFAPNHEAVLNAMAVAALKAGNPSAAKPLLERAVARNAGVAGIWVNLAAACRQTNDAPGERLALDRAHALAPQDYVVLLQKGVLLERDGAQFEACGLYQQALAYAPPAAQVPPVFVSLLNHALAAVREQSQRMDAQLEAALAPVRAAHGGQAQGRFEHGLAAMLGKTRIYVPQPTFLHIPGLPVTAFYDRGQYPWLADLEAQAAAIGAEALAAVGDDAAGLEPYVSFSEPLAAPEWAHLNHSPSWAAYRLWQDGAPVEAHLQRCPATAALLDRLPLADLPGNAPNVYFAVLAPGVRVPPHFGVTNARGIVYLPLAVPEGGYLRVGAEVRPLSDGVAVAFDDSLEHELGNPGASPQVVLVLDVWNPHLNEAEKALLRTTFRESAVFARRASMFAGRL